jgi:hypothetical protein
MAIEDIRRQGLMLAGGPTSATLRGHEPKPQESRPSESRSRTRRSAADVRDGGRSQRRH